MIRSLHLQSMRNEDLHGGHDEHALFQASTVSALLDGAYDGDLTFADLASQGDTGLGTLNGLDGELIADGPTADVLTSSPAYAPQLAKVFAPARVMTADELVRGPA